MSRSRLALRLGWSDLRRRPAETLLLLVATAVAATTLTIGLVLHGQTATPFAETRAATDGPDAVALLTPPPHLGVTPKRLHQLQALGRAPGVTAGTGLLPVTWTSLDVGSLRAVAEIQGRDASPSPVDRPHLVDGTWVRPGGAVVERAFAQALSIGVGDRIDLGGRSVPVVGVAVSAALPSYPRLCTIGCILDEPSWGTQQPGLVWLPRHEIASYTNRREPLTWMTYVKLSRPAQAPAFAAAHTSRSPNGPYVTPWQEVARRHAETLTNERAVAWFGSSLLVVLALATVVVLVGGRMAEESRRVGTLKALGASPGFVVRSLLASYVGVGLVAGLVGLLVGRLTAPLLVTPSAGLLGTEGATTVTLADAATVLGTMVLVVLVASLVPAWRAARTSTVRALADAGRRPRRSRLLIRLSTGMPAPALLGLRLAGRRPRRALLTAGSIAVAVCGAVVVIRAQANLGAEAGPSSGPADPDAAQLHTVMLALTVLLAVMAAVILVFVTRASAADARSTLAVARALGASPAESATGLAVAQVVPAVVGLVVGIVAGTLLFHMLSPAHTVPPSVAAWLVVVVGTVAATAALTAVPARLEARRPIADVLREA